MGRGELSITTFENITAISYDANIETANLQLTDQIVDAGVNYAPAIGLQFLHIIGTGVIADPDAKFVDIGVQDLQLTNQAIDAGVYQRRRLVLIN